MRGSGSDDGSGDDQGRVNGIQSVDRAVQILELLARNGRTGVVEVAAELGVHKSTASRLLSALESRDLVEQDAARGKYDVGVGVLRLASTVSARLSIVQRVRPSLERLAEEFGETANLAVSRAGHAVNVDQAMGRSPLTTYDWIGNATPLHATASGKIMLAAMSPAERTRVLGRRPLSPCTDATITSRRALDAELREIAETGLAATRGELVDGLNAAAVAVLDHRGVVVGSISLSGPAVRFDPADPAVIDALRSEGAEASARMGHSPSP
ncbi:MAG TPA: IclR family transcriptional regulator [Microlunatus sp.]|nr:IclR family transcriptional regulator [Microlunatus sp.]